MDTRHMKLLKHPALLLMIALIAGIWSGFHPYPAIMVAASAIELMFVNLLKLISLPLIFLAIVSTITQMNTKQDLMHYGSKVLKYTLLTTIIAATIGLGLFVWI